MAERGSRRRSSSCAGAGARRRPVRRARAAGLRSLPVVDGGAVVGVLSRADLLPVLAGEDDEIVRDLSAALAAELGPHHEVHVDVTAGVVLLRGRSARQLAAAGLVAARVPGVVQVETSPAPWPHVTP